MKIRPLFLLAALQAAALSIGHAEDGALHLQYSLIVAHDGTLNLYNVPASGGKSYDIECHLAVAEDGSLHIEGGKAVISPVLADSTQHFTPGEYQCVAGGNYSNSMTITGPVLAPGGRQIWTWVWTQGGVQGGTWTTGPVEGHPQLKSVTRGAIFPKGFTLGKDSNGNLVAVQQLGNKVIIGTLTNTTNTATRQEEYGMCGFFVLEKKPDPSN